MMLTLKQAAEESGKSKPTILRAIQSGKITAKRDTNNEWQIDPAELFRVYERITRNDASTVTSPTGVTDETVRGLSEISALRREIEVRDETVQALRAERDRERRQLEGMIDDLRRRLDTAEEERRAKDTQLTALLTDQRERQVKEAEKAAEVSLPAPEPEPRKGFAAWFFGKG